MNNFKHFYEANIPYGDNPFDSITGKTIVFFDTETTGINPSGNQITELAAKSIDGDTLQELDEFHLHAKLTEQTLAKIESEITNPPEGPYAKTVEEILKMTNYYNYQAEATEPELIQKFSQWLPEGSVIVAHNAKFDLKMVNTRANIHGIDPITHFSKVLDTMQMSREFFIPASQELELENPEIKDQLDRLTTKFTKSGKRAKVSSRLGDLIDALGETLKNWHEAMADVDATIKIFKQFKTFFDKHHGSGVEQKDSFKRRYSRAHKLRYRK